MVFLLLLLVYFFFIKKKTVNTDTSVLFPNTNDSNNTQQTTNTQPTTNTTINISNVSLSPSPLIGQLHLIANVSLTNQPNIGALRISLGNAELMSIDLPVINDVYLLDTYVGIANTNTTQYLTAKIGSITKTVQVQL